jgi:nitrate/nitrite-specific signal transduction histidine kinase
MQIVDDGAGIEPSAPSTNGMGLKIMKYRARMIGAEIEVSRRAEGGTTVTCRYQPAIDRSTVEKHGSN